MFQEREFLLQSGVDVVDFSMQDPRNLPSPYSDYFVANKAYDQAQDSLNKAFTAISLVHSPEAVHKFNRLIRETKPDIVHCHNIYHQLTPSIIGVAKDAGIPVVLTLHDYKPICPTYTRLNKGRVCSECIGGSFGNVVKYRCADASLGKSLLLYAEAQVQRILKSYEKVDRFIAPSQFMRSSVTEFQLPKDQVDVIYNGIACDALASSNRDQEYVLYIGRLSHEKGVQTLLSAHAEVAERIPLVIAGTGPLEKELRENYPKAKYLGHVSGGDAQSVIEKAALVVVPSEWYENCPMAVLEAMALGKPVLASEIGGIPELVLHEETGLLFAPGDGHALKEGLLRLMTDAELRKRFGIAARTRAESVFSNRQHNAKLLELYHTLIRHTRKPKGRS